VVGEPVELGWLGVVGEADGVGLVKAVLLDGEVESAGIVRGQREGDVDGVGFVGGGLEGLDGIHREHMLQVAAEPARGDSGGQHSR